MGLAPGSQFGAFELLALLGAGGMGQVFRARDVRLGREVALKVLPDHLSSDSERLARFTREARALAALNHPNIAAIYDIVEVDGTRALVLEFVEGETLEHRLRRGTPSLAEVKTLARAIAAALDAAHDRGLIHRDLKPANVMITSSGDVKLLDFGIARALGDEGTNDAPTLVATQRGVIVGTAAYMSPEQARGHAVDKRTDVWAFGCVLFEMLSGRTAFGGQTWSDSIARTLTEAPDWTALPSTTPSGIRRLLELCLQKDPQQRLRGLGGVELAFEDASPPRRPTSAARWAFAALVLSIAAAAIAMLWLWRGDRPPSLAAAPIRFEIPPSIQVAESGTMALSPDGSRFVFIGTGADGRFQMWERALESLDARPISGSEGEVAANSTVFWSPDGRSIGFYSDGAVRRINREGGVAEIVCRVPGVAVGGSWNNDGVIVVGNTAGGLVRCPAAGGEPTPVTSGGTPLDTAANRGLHLFPKFLRDGHRLLYFRVSRTDPSGNGLLIADLRLPPDRQDQTRLLETGFAAKYVVTRTGDERILFVRNRNVWSVGFDSRRPAIVGEPVQVASSVYTFRDGASFDATGDVFVYRGGAPDYQVVWRNRAGGMVATVGDPGAYSGIALSPDANRVALTRENRLNRSDQDLWIVDVQRNTTSRFTSDTLPESVPAWSADGQQLVFAVGHDDGEVRAKAINGTTERTVLKSATLEGRRVNPLLTTFSASRDGQWLALAVDTRGARRSDIWVLSMSDAPRLAPLVEQDFDQRQPALSPDQRWLAYVSNESGVDEVMIRPLTWSDGVPPSAGAAIPVSRGGARSPRWRGDSRELFFQLLSGEIAVAAVATDAIGSVRPLFAAPGVLAEWDVAADGQRFLLAQPTENYNLPFTVVMNWSQPGR